MSMLGGEDESAKRNQVLDDCGSILLFVVMEERHLLKCAILYFSLYGSRQSFDASSLDSDFELALLTRFRFSTFR